MDAQKQAGSMSNRMLADLRGPNFPVGGQGHPAFSVWASVWANKLALLYDILRHGAIP